MCHKANKQHFLAINPRRCFGALKKSRKQFSPQWVSPTTGAEGGSERPLDLHHQESSSTSRSAKWKNEYRAERPKTNAVRPTPPALCMGCTLLCYRLFCIYSRGIRSHEGCGWPWYPSEAAACRIQLWQSHRQGCRWHGGKAELNLAQLGSGTEGSIPMCQHAPSTSRPPTPNTALLRERGSLN